jgi:hypothetical protein
VRGGRSKRFFYPNAAALRAVRQSLGRIDALTEGLETVLKPK